MEGQRNGELEEARIAARHFGVRHHELVIPQRALETLLKRSLLETDRVGYGGFIDVALADALRADGRWMDVHRGEDTRLHTPALDTWALLGLAAMRLGVHRSALGRSLYSLRRALNHWPLRRGRNYLRYAVTRSELASDLRRFGLGLARYHIPASCEHELPAVLEHAARDLLHCRSLDEYYRHLVALEYRLQYTEDMHAGFLAVETERTRLVAPFYHPAVVEACNRVPISMGLRPILASPTATRSHFPVADKYVLRKLLANRAPPALLYRRKATAGAEDAIHTQACAGTFAPAFSAWGDELLEQLDEPSRSIAGHELTALRASGSARESTMLMLCALAHLVANPRCDLLADLDAAAGDHGSARKASWHA